MELHWFFTYMLKKNQITIAEMITIIFMSEEMQNLLEARIRNGMDVDSLFNESKDMVVTLDMKSLKRKVKQFEKRDAKDVIQPLMDKKLPVEMNGCAKDAIIKEMKHNGPSEKMELVISNAFLPLLVGETYRTVLARKGYCKVANEDRGIKKQ